MRRFERDRPSPSDSTSSAVADVVEIIERLAHAHEDDVRDRAGLAPAGSLGPRAAREIAEPLARNEHLLR